MKINKIDPNNQTHVYPTLQDGGKMKKDELDAKKVKGKKGKGGAKNKKGFSGFGNPYRNPA